jgi:C-terminal processing protease CtpA/Prc
VKDTTEPRLQVALSEEEAFSIYSDMLSELKDGHVSLYAPFNTWNYYDLYLEHGTNYYEDIVQKNYLNEVNSIGPFIYDIIDNNIGYLRYASFGDDIEDQHLVYLSEYFKGTNGIIIDIRGNLGGASENVAQLLKLSLAEDTKAGKIFTREDGILMEDEHWIRNSEEFSPYAGPIILLTNRQCYSSCNIYASYASQFPKYTLIGDQTGGGSGLAVANELPNGWQYRYSAGKITLADGTEIENGIAPDINISTDASHAANGIDAILDEALQQIK